MTLATFAVVAFIGIVTPGPTVLLAFTNGSRFGVRHAFAGMAGAVAADFVLIGAAGVGLGALLAASEFWFTVLKWAGAAYLGFLGLMMLRSTGSLAQARAGASKLADPSPSKMATRCFVVAATNPKYYLFFSAFLPQFVDPAAPQFQQYALLALVMGSIDFLVMTGYAVLGARAARALSDGAVRWLDRLSGGALLALAGSLAFYRRAAS